MISRKLFPKINFSILYNKVITKSNFVCGLGYRNYDKNINNIVILSRKGYCTNIGINIPPQGIMIEKKTQMTEEDRVNIEKWLEMCKCKGIKVPNKISEEHLLEFFEANTEIDKKSYLNFLVKRELARLNSKSAKEMGKAFNAEQKQKRMLRLKGHIENGLWKNSMFAKLTKRHIMDLYQHKMISVMKFGQPLIIDLGFESYMKGRELSSYVTQLVMSISLNRANNDPFNLMFCNVDFDSKGFNKFKKMMPNIEKPNFPITITSKNYLDMFPKEKLVYLSPDADETLETFDHDAVYIIGGIVDLREDEPLTSAKAKRENIKLKKLPLDNCHIFKGSIRLGIQVITAILLDVRKDGDWNKAFRAIRRKWLTTEKKYGRPETYKTKPWSQW